MSNIQVTPEKLRQISKTCRTQAGQVNDVRRVISNSIESSGWKSPAANKFRNDWNSHYATALRDLNRALEKLGQAANQMAANYDATERSYRGAA